MIILYGRTGSGKTEWFRKRYSESRILHASSLQELRQSILSVQSPLLDEVLPTLINSWFDLDVKDILDLAKIDVTIETHFFETSEGIRITVHNGQKFYWGLRNEILLRKIDPRSVVYFPPRKKDHKKRNLVELFGTRYNMIKSQFPELLE